MATENNPFIPNVAKGAGSDDLWPAIWAYSRCMKKAGWKYLASSDNDSMDTSADPARDLWTPTEEVDALQVWQVDDDGGPSFVDLTTGFNDGTVNNCQPFPSAEAVGDYFAIGHSSRFHSVRLDRIGGTQGTGSGDAEWEYWNGSIWTALTKLTDETGNATGGTFRDALADDHVFWEMPNDWALLTLNSVQAYYIRARLTVVYSTDPVISQGQIILVNSDVGTTANTGSVANITTVADGRCTVTGLTGMTADSKGRYLLLGNATTAVHNNLHQIEEFVSASEVRVDARTFVLTGSDANNGSITWDEIDPRNESLPSKLLGNGAWSVWQGPSTIKIPITAAPVPGTDFDFLSGENVTQATSNAEGEILGFVFDTVNLVGHLVILPRVIGTGSETPYKWTTGEEITGATSGATVTQDGTALEYRHQMVLAKGTNFPEEFGHMYAQSFEPVGEAVEDFLALAQSAGCTATVQPGGGGTGNAFPTHAWVILGTANATAGEAIHGSNSAFTVGNSQIICRDCIWESGYSTDGTAMFLFAHTGGYYDARAFHRMDDTEPGDLSPYTTYGLGSNSLYSSAGRTAATDSSSVSSTNRMNTVTWDTTAASHTWFKGWHRRGLGTNDVYGSYEPFVSWPLISTDNLPVTESRQGTAETVATEPEAVKSREPVRLGSLLESQKTRKGAIRHFTLIQGGVAGQTYGNGKFLQASSTSGAVVVPWDEVTLPQAT